MIFQKLIHDPLKWRKNKIKGLYIALILKQHDHHQYKMIIVFP